jgi:hypothetical protein
MSEDLIFAVAVPTDGVSNPFVVGYARDAAVLAGIEYDGLPILIGPAVQTDVQSEYSAWDLIERLGGDMEAAAAELWADLPEEVRAGCRLDAGFYRDPEPAGEEEAMRVWIESDLANEAKVGNLALRKAGMCYATISAMYGMPYIDLIIRA